VKKWFWLLAGLGVFAYLWSKREVHATVTAGEATVTYKGTGASSGSGESIWVVGEGLDAIPWTAIDFD